MVSIVYEGVGGAGSLFKDMKFFILQKVPMRSRWIELIQSNGGKVEKFETKADILIADGLRKDAPPGSVSWKFIEESGKAGELLDIEAYRCGAPAGANAAQTSTTAQPAKATRTPFTAEDDRLLAKCVLKGMKSGEFIKGNKFYMELANQHPHHTYQSWLDRSKRHILPRYEAGDLTCEEEDDESPHPEQAKPNKREPAKSPAAKDSREKLQAHGLKGKATVPASLSLSKLSSSRACRPITSKATSSQARFQEPVAGRPSTEEDDDDLQPEVKDTINLDSNKEIEAWEQWSEVHGRHTALEWRDCFNNELRPREEEAREKRKTAKTKAATSVRQKVGTPQDENSETTARPSLPTHKHGKTGVNDLIKSSQNAKTIVDQKSKTPKAMSSEIDLENRPYSKSLLEDEKYFTKTLKTFSEYLGYDSEDVVFFPEIRGKQISLFTLWQIVMLFGGFTKTSNENRWEEIADRLSFPITNRAKAAKDLKQCYDEILSALEKSLVEAGKDENNPEYSASQEETLIASQFDDEILRNDQRTLNLEEKSDFDEVLEAPQSLIMPNMFSKKRTIDSDNLSTHSGSSGGQSKHQNKRPKIDKGKGTGVEIPSTPEHIYNATQKPISHRKSPLKYQLDQSGDNTSSDHEAQESFLSLQRKKTEGSFRKVSGKKPMLEPETQDFHYSDIDDGISVPSPTAAPKKRILHPAIDISDDSSTESDSETESLPKLKSVSELKSKSKTRTELGLKSQSSLQPESKSKSESKSRTQPEENSQNSFDYAAEIEKFIDLGYSEEIIFQALEATTYVFDIASVVMEQLKEEQSVPGNLVGVWTEEDDAALFKRTGIEYERIRMKHGDERITKRQEFKETMAAVDDSQSSSDLRA